MSLLGADGYEKTAWDYLEFETKVMIMIKLSPDLLEGKPIHQDSTQNINRLYGLALKLQDQVLLSCILCGSIEHFEKVFRYLNRTRE